MCRCIWFADVMVASDFSIKQELRLCSWGLEKGCGKSEQLLQMD